MKILKSREIKELTPLHSQQVAEREFGPRRHDRESHTHDTKSHALLSPLHELVVRGPHPGLRTLSHAAHNQRAAAERAFTAEVSGD